MTAFETPTALASAGEYGPALMLPAAIEEPAARETLGAPAETVDAMVRLLEDRR